MKKFIIPLLVLLSACTSHEKPGKNYNKQDSTAISDTIAKAVVQKSADPVVAIRQQVEHINTAKLLKNTLSLYVMKKRRWIIIMKRMCLLR